VCVAVFREIKLSVPLRLLQAGDRECNEDEATDTEDGLLVTLTDTPLLSCGYMCLGMLENGTCRLRDNNVTSCIVDSEHYTIGGNTSTRDSYFKY
jgi:hypothetical protein